MVHGSSHTDNLSNNVNDHSRGKSRDSLDQNKRISSEIFFACDNCDGPLIPHTLCRICKKTDQRICLKCATIKTFGDHRNCLRILLVDMKKIFPKGEKPYES